MLNKEQVDYAVERCVEGLENMDLEDAAEVVKQLMLLYVASTEDTRPSQT